MPKPTQMWGGLGPLIASLQPRPESDGKTIRWAMPDPMEIGQARDCCDSAITTLALGISTIGRLMVRRDETNPLGREEVENIGDLLASLGETIHQLRQLDQALQDQAREADA